MKNSRRSRSKRFLNSWAVENKQGSRFIILTRDSTLIRHPGVGRDPFLLSLQYASRCGRSLTAPHHLHHAPGDCPRRRHTLPFIIFAPAGIHSNDRLTPQSSSQCRPQTTPTIDSTLTRHPAPAANHSYKRLTSHPSSRRRPGSIPIVTAIRWSLWMPASAVMTGLRPNELTGEYQRQRFSDHRRFVFAINLHRILSLHQNPPIVLRRHAHKFRPIAHP